MNIITPRSCIIALCIFSHIITHWIWLVSEKFDDFDEFNRNEETTSQSETIKGVPWYGQQHLLENEALRPVSDYNLNSDYDAIVALLQRTDESEMQCNEKLHLLWHRSVFHL